MVSNPGMYRVSLIFAHGGNKTFELYADSALDAEAKVRKYAEDKAWPHIVDIAVMYKNYTGE